METITIECRDDGSYRVSSTEDKQGEPGDATLDKTVQSVDEVLQLIQAELADDADDGDAAKQWADEAAKRGPDGQPLPPGAGAQAGGAGPAMYM